MSGSHGTGELIREDAAEELAPYCQCENAAHEPDHEWTPGHPHTRYALVRDVIALGTLGLKFCQPCIDGVGHQS